MKAKWQAALVSTAAILLAAGVRAQQGQASSQPASESDVLITLEVDFGEESVAKLRVRDGTMARVAQNSDAIGISPLAQAKGGLVDVVVMAIDDRGEGKETIRELDRLTDLALGEWRESSAAGFKLRVVEIGQLPS